MIKCEVINQNLTVREFKRLKNIKRLKNNNEIEQFNYFEVGDTFETDEEYAKYLSGELKEQPIVCVKILEVIPDKKEKSNVAKATKKKIDKKK